MSYLDFPSFFRLIQEAPSIMLVVLSFNDCRAMSEFIKCNLSLPRLPNLTYRLARRRRKDIRLQVTEDAALDSHSSHFDGGQRDENIPETSFDSHWYIGARKMNRTKGLEYGDYIWELIDPETLELTGSSPCCLHKTSP